MEQKKAQSCLKTFFEVSKIQIDKRDKDIQRKIKLKRFLDVKKKSEINREIEIIVEERNRIQGQLDCVRLEVLDMMLDRLDLVTEEMIVKKQCANALEFIKQEKEDIELRGMYKLYPCSIEEVLNVGLSACREEVSFSLFDESGSNKATKEDVQSAVNPKNVKMMIKNM